MSRRAPSSSAPASVSICARFPGAGACAGDGLPPHAPRLFAEARGITPGGTGLARTAAVGTDSPSKCQSCCGATLTLTRREAWAVAAPALGEQQLPRPRAQARHQEAGSGPHCRAVSPNRPGKVWVSSWPRGAFAGQPPAQPLGADLLGALRVWPGPGEALQTLVPPRSELGPNGSARARPVVCCL